MKLLLFLLLALLPVGSYVQAPPAATDVILRTDGTETSGRVITITPLQVRYLPPASADTLRLPAADVFLVRYANGTRGVLHPVAATASAPAPAAPDLLPGLNAMQRAALGRRDAKQGYTSHGGFWGSLGAGLYGGPVFGLVAPAIITSHAIAPRNLGAPHAELLADPAYGGAYRPEAQRRKRGRAWGGYAAGSALCSTLFFIALANVTPF